MPTIPGLHVSRRKNETEEDATVRTALEAMRDPNRPLPERLVAFRVLDGRRGLNRDQRDSVAIHRAVLARLVTQAGAVEAYGETFRVDARGELRSAMK